MTPKRARRAGVRLSLVAVAAAAAVGLTGTTATGNESLQIAAVVARDAKTIDIRFDRELSPELRSLVQSNNTNDSYVHQFVRITGGQAGEPDAALTGTALSTAVSGTRNYDVDIPAHDTLRIVLGGSASLVDGRTYQLALDGNRPAPAPPSTVLGDLLFIGADGSPIGTSTTPPVSFTGVGSAAPLPALASVSAVNSRTLKVTFARTIVSGMPRNTFTAPTNVANSNIRIARDGSSEILAPSYIEPIPGTDNTQFDLLFATDLDPAATYTLTLARALNLATTGGQLGSGVNLTAAGISGAGPAFSEPDIESATVNAARDELRIRFNRRLTRVKTPNGPAPSGNGNVSNNGLPQGWQFIRETENASGVGIAGYSVSGTTIGASDVRALLDLTGTVADDGGSVGPWNVVSGSPTSAADRLRDVAGYFPDRRTLVLKFQSGVRLAPGSAGSVALRADTVFDVTGKSNPAGGQSVPFTAPTGSVPATSTYDPSAPDYLTIDRDAKTSFLRHDFVFAPGTTPPNFNVRSQDTRTWLVKQQFDTIVVENKYIKATFLPSYGGRLLSMIYKPTGNDLLYTNPVGNPYGIGAGNFYANWLMVYAGVFPTFSTAEHGKYWFSPFDYEIVETADKIDIVMTRLDDIAYSARPSKFPSGATGLRLTATYSVSKTSPLVDMTVKIENPTTGARTYEYWTCTTLSPGVKTAANGSPTMEIVAPVSQIKQGGSGYNWMQTVETVASGSGGSAILHFDKMRKMTNWVTGSTYGGIAYGQGLATNPQGNWWGVVNQENTEGVIRLGQNDQTPGLKLWEWGHNYSFNSNPYTRTESARPYIELWAGVTNEFFQTTSMPAGGSRQWTESYMPTMDMKDTTNANRNGAAYLEFSADRKVTGRVFTTRFGQTVTAKIVDTVTDRVIATQTFVGDPLKSAQLSGSAPAGTRARLILTDAAGETLLTADRSDGLGTIDPPVAEGVPTISGTAAAGETLTGTDTTWSGSTAQFAYAWLRDGQPIAGAASTSYALTLDDVGHQIAFRVTATNDGGTVSAVSSAVVPVSRVNADGTVGGSVAPTLSLVLGAPASFGSFAPGVGQDYAASSTATVISTAGDAALSVADPSATATGRLVNGTFALAQPLQVRATGPFAPLNTNGAPLTLLTYSGPVSNDSVTLGFQQTIGASEPLRTGTYSKTLTFTLSTTNP